MSDWADLAAEREGELRSDALAAQARRARLPDAQSAETCALCEAYPFPQPVSRR